MYLQILCVYIKSALGNMSESSEFRFENSLNNFSIWNTSQELKLIRNKEILNGDSFLGVGWKTALFNELNFYVRLIGTIINRFV